MDSCCTSVACWLLLLLVEVPMTPAPTSFAFATASDSYFATAITAEPSSPDHHEDDEETFRSSSSTVFAVTTGLAAGVDKFDKFETGSTSLPLVTVPLLLLNFMLFSGTLLLRRDEPLAPVTRFAGVNARLWLCVYCYCCCCC